MLSALPNPNAKMFSQTLKLKEEHFSLRVLFTLLARPPPPVKENLKLCAVFFRAAQSPFYAPVM
jgi:hypothetical protein